MNYVIDLTDVNKENASEKMNRMYKALYNDIELEYETGVFIEKGQDLFYRLKVDDNGIIKEINKSVAAICPGSNKLSTTPEIISKDIRKSSEFKNILKVNITSNKPGRIEKAVRYTSFSLGVPLQAAKGEPFVYQAQEDLSNKVINDLTDRTRSMYDFIVEYFALPSCAFVTKAFLTHKGKILYNPETGTPLEQKDWKKFCDALEKFMNRNYSGAGKRFILSSEALGRMLDRMLKEQEKRRTVKTIPLSKVTFAGGKSIDWISDDVKNLAKTFDTITRKDMARIQVAVDSAAQRVAGITDRMRGDMQQIIIDGIKNRQSKGKVSQNLFDRCASLNRDIQRIADTEMQNNFNMALIKEEVHGSEPGKRVYFRRVEIIDDNTCAFCRKIDGEIAAWSAEPLTTDRIKDPYADYAIWEGKENQGNEKKIPYGVVHPYCRGVWERYYPEMEEKINEIKGKV